ncbi:hypothetical protein K402DRAFT_424106 [Aulographum hederae CBS 113979]|uniref:Uncharacterized protein n=1 Tax=Aulographum hederae CBS 113979 TaxID=1176131 RepID=A0A6G1GQT5_9PEZI|nr:hypothetical protein K402DRAFT_424106 [Aulographum hederae CBS 113979]
MAPLSEAIPGSHHHDSYKDTTYSSTDHDDYAHAGSGTVGGAGFGNKSAPDSADLSEQHSNTRFGTHHTADPYSGGHETYGSGATGGAGFGNKSAPDAGDLTEEISNTKFAEAGKNDKPYSGHMAHGSGSTGGAGFGNKTSDGFGGDSVTGKMMEKVGGMMKNEGMVEKGHQKRVDAGLEE